MSGDQSRRRSRAKRIDVFREWQDGNLHEEGASRERWTREGQTPRRKVHGDRPLVALEEMGEGIVAEKHRRTCAVYIPGTGKLVCRYSPNLDTREESGIAIGDWVIIAKEEASGDIYVTEILPRTSKLSRPGPPDREHREQLLAANIDQLVVVSSATQPVFNPGFIDRYLVVAQYSNIPLVLVINKADLVDEMPPVVADFEKMLASVVIVSAHTQVGFAQLKEQLKGKISVLTGQSGVGKSSLVRACLPELENIDVGDVREKDGKGRHTTIASTLFKLPEELEGGWLIDTPGIRGLGFWNMSQQELSQFFPPFGEIWKKCKFNNCRHLTEPQCAVRAAIENADIPKRFYRSYKRIMDSLPH